MMRSLYSYEYLQSGCSIPLDEDYAVDNTLWTWVTAYSASGMALLSGLFIFYSDRVQALLMTSFFIISAVGYGTAGWSHQATETKDDWQYRILGPLSTALTLLGTACLMRSGLLYYFFADSLFANLLLYTSNTAIIIIVGLEQSDVIAAIWMVIVYAGMSIVYFRQATSDAKIGREWLLLKIVAMFVAVVGFLIQYIFWDTCGIGGLATCFEGCPLANPAAFNNTAIKNILAAIAVIFLAIAEVFLPSHQFWEMYDDVGQDFTINDSDVEKSQDIADERSEVSPVSLERDDSYFPREQ